MCSTFFLRHRGWNIKYLYLHNPGYSTLKTWVDILWDSTYVFKVEFCFGHRITQDLDMYTFLDMLNIPKRARLYEIVYLQHRVNATIPSSKVVGYQDRSSAHRSSLLEPEFTESSAVLPTPTPNSHLPPLSAWVTGKSITSTSPVI